MKATIRTTQTLRLALGALLIVGSLAAPALLTAADKGKSKIADQMGIMNDNYKTLRRSARGKEFSDESVKLVGQMITAAQAAKEMTPPMADKKSGAEKDKFIADYKK